MSRTPILLLTAIASLAAVAATAGAAAKPKPLTVKAGLFSGKNDNLTLTAVVSADHRNVLVEFKARMKCPEEANVGVTIDTAIDRKNPIARRGSFRARGPDQDLRGPFKTSMRISGRFVTPTRARGTFRFTDARTGCDSGEIAFTLRHDD